MSFFSKLFLSTLLFAPLAHAGHDLDFNFTIKGDHFHLEITQQFNTPVNELRKNFAPNFLSQISNVVRSVEVTPLTESSSEISITSSKHGLSNTIVADCSEKSTADSWASSCVLDLKTADTGDYFSAGSETINCIPAVPQNPALGSSCKFIVDADVKPQKIFVFYRSSEVLALGGIVERIHDQAVLSRVVNLGETPATAMTNLENSSIGTCLNQIYATYQNGTKKQSYLSNVLSVQASLWRCNAK
jgi:hypothetical protein